MADEYHPSVDPSDTGSYEVSSTSQNVSIPRALSVAPVDSTIINAASIKLQEDLVRTDIANRLNPVYAQIDDILQSTKNVKDEKLAGNEQKYEALKQEALELKKSYEGMTGGAYKYIEIGYDKYLSDINNQRKVVADYKEDLRQAQERGDPYEVDRLINISKGEQRKLDELRKVDPWNSEKYPVRQEQTRVLEGVKYAQGWGIGGWHGTGEEGAKNRDIIEASMTGGTIGASTPATRAAAAAEAAAKAGKTTPEITQNYISDVLARFNKNPYDNTLSQQDRVIVSAFKQLQDPTSSYTTAGMAQIAQRLVDAGLTPSQAGAIVSIAPQGKGSAAYQDIVKILEQQANVRQTLRAQIMSQEEAVKVKPVIASSPSVNLGEMKKPFLSTIATSKMGGEEKPVQKDMLSRVSDFFGGSPLGSKITGKSESEDLKKFNRYVDLTSPAIMVSGGGAKLPAGTTKGATTFLDTLFGAAKTPSVAKGISASAIVGGSLSLGTGKIDRTPSGGYGAAWSDIKITTKTPTIKDLSENPAKTGLFSREWFEGQAKNPKLIQQAQLEGAFKGGLTSQDLMGGADRGKLSETAYGKFMATYGDVDKAAKIKTQTGENYYLIVGSKGQYQIRNDLWGGERWSADQGEGSFNRLMSQGVDPIATILAREKNPDATIRFGETGSMYSSSENFKRAVEKNAIDLNNPVEIQSFAQKNVERAKGMVALKTAQDEQYQHILKSRVERERGVAIGSMSMEDYLKTTKEKSTFGDTVQTINKAINPIGASAYEVKLNETNPYTGLQFKTSKSATVSGILNSLDGSPLTEQQRKTITSEEKNLPIEDKVVLDKFLNIYEGQNKTYDKLNADLKTYNPDDNKSRAQVISDIQEYSKYSPQGAKDMLQMVKDLDVGTQIQKNNMKVVEVSSTSSPFAINMILKNGKLIPVDTTKTPLSKTISEQQALIDKIKTPSIKEQMQASLDESVQYGKINRELNNADIKTISSFENMVNSLKLTPPDQKAALITQYKNYGEAKSLTEKSEELVAKAPKYGISDKELSDLKIQMSKNPVLSSVNEKTGKTYADEITSGIEKTKAGIWTAEDYKKSTGGLDIFTATNLRLREQAQADVEARGANVFNVGASAIVGTGAAIPLTIYGTLRSFGIGGAAQEAQLQEGTKAPIPTLGSMANLGDVIVAPRTEPFTKPFVAPARMIGGGIGYTAGLIYDIPASALGGRKFGDLGEGGRKYGSELGATLLSEPLEKPISGGVLPYLGGYGIGKVFGAISAYKTAKLITPALERNAAKITDIEKQLAATRTGVIKAGGETKFPPATTKNPLARGGAGVIEGSSDEATRLALYGQEKSISRSTRMWKAADTAIDFAIGAPFLVGMGADLLSTSADPTITGQKLSGLAIMGAGGSSVLGKKMLMEAKLGETGAGASGWTAESIGWRRRALGSEVEDFYPALSIVKSPTSGVRLPFTSKEMGYSLQLGTPRLYSEVRDIQPARTAMSASDEAFYQTMVKDLAKDAAIRAETPVLTKTKKLTKTDALMQQVLKDLDKVDKRKYEKLPAGELEKIAEMSAKYKNVANFESGITPSGKIVPKEVDVGILSAEMVRQSKEFKDVNTLSPLGRQLLYETILESNTGRAQTPLSRTLVNASDKISGKTPTYGNYDINFLPTTNQRLFGDVRIKTTNPLEASIIQNFLKEREIRTAAKAQLEQIKIQKRINERQAVINKLEDEVLRTGRAEISRQDVSIVGLDHLKPAKDGKFYIREKDLMDIRERIALEEQQLVWLGQVHEAAIEIPWDTLLSPELKGYKPKVGELERPFLMDQFGGNIKTEFIASPPMGTTPASLRITNILPEFVMNKETGYTERQFIKNEAHIHPAEHPPSSFDVMQLFRYPSQTPLVEHSMVKTPNLDYYVVGRPKTIKTGGKQWQSFTQPKVEAFGMMLQLGQNKILSEMAGLKRGEPVKEGSWLAESGIKVFTDQSQEKALQRNFFDQGFAMQVPTFKLSTDKKTGKVGISGDYIGDLNTRLATSLKRLQTLEDVKRRSVIGDAPPISIVELAMKKSESPIRETRQIVEDKIPIDQRETFFRRQDISQKKPSKEIEKVGSYYTEPASVRAIIPEVKGRSPSVIPEIGKYVTEPNPQKAAFEKQQSIYDKFLYKGFQGMARLHVLADRVRFEKEGKIGSYYKTPLEQREGVIPAVKSQSPREVELVGEYHKKSTDKKETFFKREDISQKKVSQKDIDKIGSYYKAPSDIRAIVPDVKERSPSVVPEIGKYVTEPNPQKAAFEKQQGIYDKFLYKGFQGMARLHVLADRVRFEKEGKIGSYYKTPLEQREGVIPAVKAVSPRDVPLVGKYHEGYTYLKYKMGEVIPEEVRSKIPDDASFGLKDNPQRRIVVLKNGEPVAMASYRTPIMEGNALILDEIASFRKGSGKELIRTAENVAREEGLTKIEVKPTPDVKGFYEKTGFRETKGGVWEKPVSKSVIERQDIGISGDYIQPTSADFKTRQEAREITGALRKNNITDEYLKGVWKSREEQVKTRPESEKLRLERQLQKDTSSLQLDHRKHVLPAIKAMLDDKKVPNSEKVAREIMKGLEEQDAVLYGSLIQDATLRLAKAEKLPYEPPITRQARDIDAHLRNPNIAAYKLTDMINKAAGDKVVEVKDGNPIFVKKYDREQSKLFDLHDADAEGVAGERGSYIGRGMVQPSRLTMTRKPLIMEGGSLKTITLSEQASRKFEGTGVFTEQPRKVMTEEGVSTAGSMIPEHGGRIKDIGDAWQIKQFQADLLEARGNPLKAEKVRAESDRWLSLYGESVEKDARAKAKQARYDFLKDIGYDTKKQKLQVPTPSIAATGTPKKYAPTQAPAQKYSMKISTPQKYNYGGYKSPSRYVSASKTSMASQFKSQYASSISKSMISPSIIKMRSPSPSPYVGSPSPSISPSISRSISRSISPSVSPSVSPSKSPYRSPSRYSSPMSYEMPRITTPPFMLGGLGGGGGGDDPKRRKIIRRYGMRAGIRTGEEILVTGKYMPEFNWNLGGAEQIFNKKKVRKMFA